MADSCSEIAIGDSCRKTGRGKEQRKFGRVSRPATRKEKEVLFAAAKQVAAGWLGTIREIGGPR